MTKARSQSRTPEEIIARYPSLTPKVRANLTDFYNHFLGLQLIAYGKNSQQAMEIKDIRHDISRGKEPFVEDPLASYYRNEINSGRVVLTPSDLEHITELTDLIHSLNIAAKSRALNQKTARKAYDLLIPYLYGRKVEAGEIK